MGAEGEPLVDHLALLQAVQQAAHEHWREERQPGEEEKIQIQSNSKQQRTSRCCDGEALQELTDVTLFALFGFVAQADFKSVDFTGQVAARAEGGEEGKNFNRVGNVQRHKCWLEAATGGSDSLEDELLGEHGVLPLPRVSLGHLHTVQVDVAVRAGEILDGQLVGLLHVQHQAADLRGQEYIASCQSGFCTGRVGRLLQKSQ